MWCVYGDAYFIRITQIVCNIHSCCTNRHIPPMCVICCYRTDLRNATIFGYKLMNYLSHILDRSKSLIIMC